MLEVNEFQNKVVLQPENKSSSNYSNLKVFTSMDQIIFNVNNPSPMVLLNKTLNKNENFKIYLKLEYLNPFGSIKDRAALYMLKQAKLNKDKTILEASSGNTAIALACLANSYGIPVEIAVPERIPEEKKNILRLLGVKELWEAEDDLCPIYPNEGARGVANGLVNSVGGERFKYLNQYENEANVAVHYENTGPEIYKQTEGKITHFFSSIGTGGTISGVGKFLKEKNPNIKIIGVEPSEPIHNQYGMKRITDLPKEYFPKIIDRSVIDRMEPVTDEDTYSMLKKLLANGYPVGVSTAAVIKIALNYTDKKSKGIAVVIAADNIFKYASSLQL
jgi:cysteine synthase